MEVQGQVETSSPKQTAPIKPHHESSRIIFVNPEEWVVENFLGLLIRLEYKAVSLYDASQLGDAVKAFPHSVLFFNIDKNPEGGTWFAAVKEKQDLFRELRSLPVFIGKDTREKIKSRVELDIPFDGFDMGKSPKQVFLLMQALIQQWYDKGKRQYIRVRCPSNGRSRFNLRSDGDMYQGTILDISSAGMACEFDGGSAPPRLRKGSVLAKIQLKLNSRLILVDGVVMGSRAGGSGQGENLWVIMFRNHEDSGAVQKIKDFVREQLQLEFNERLKYA